MVVTFYEKNYHRYTIHVYIMVQMESMETFCRLTIATVHFPKKIIVCGDFKQ